MNRWLIRSVQIAALSLGGLALTGTAAHADWDSGPNVGIFNGNQSSTTVQVPVNICGNAVAIVGFANANCDGGAYAVNGSGGSYSGAGSSNGYHSHNGNGNANANANSHKKKHKRHSANSNSYHNSSYGNGNSYGNSNGGNGGGGGAYAYNSNGDWTTGYNAGFFNGNQSSTTVQMPINVSCNSVAVIGFASSC
ncbi:chaplin family protein [Dactylosporangium sp. NPDC006015]|uniref:chaplin family protein n=1 Tax=unclassified Dactylosporangium TaxID=2621675 RepID=UPI0033BD5FFC